MKIGRGRYTAISGKPTLSCTRNCADETGSMIYAPYSIVVGICDKEIAYGIEYREFRAGKPGFVCWNVIAVVSSLAGTGDCTDNSGLFINAADTVVAEIHDYYVAIGSFSYTTGKIESRQGGKPMIPNIAATGQGINDGGWTIRFRLSMRRKRAHQWQKNKSECASLNKRTQADSNHPAHCVSIAREHWTEGLPK